MTDPRTKSVKEETKPKSAMQVFLESLSVDERHSLNHPLQHPPDLIMQLYHIGIRPLQALKMSHERCLETLRQHNRIPPAGSGDVSTHVFDHYVRSSESLASASSDLHDEDKEKDKNNHDYKSSVDPRSSMDGEGDAMVSKIQSVWTDWQRTRDQLDKVQSQLKRMRGDRDADFGMATERSMSTDIVDITERLGRIRDRLQSTIHSYERFVHRRTEKQKEAMKSGSIGRFTAQSWEHRDKLHEHHSLRFQTMLREVEDDQRKRP